MLRSTAISSASVPTADTVRLICNRGANIKGSPWIVTLHERRKPPHRHRCTTPSTASVCPLSLFSVCVGRGGDLCRAQPTFPAHLSLLNGSHAHC